MPDGSPIDQWWKSHRAPKPTTKKSEAMHAFDIRLGRAACGSRPAAKMYAFPPDGEVSCPGCLAVMRTGPTGPPPAVR